MLKWGEWKKFKEETKEEIDIILGSDLMFGNTSLGLKV